MGTHTLHMGSNCKMRNAVLRSTREKARYKTFTTAFQRQLMTKTWLNHTASENKLSDLIFSSYSCYFPVAETNKTSSERTDSFGKQFESVPSIAWSWFTPRWSYLLLVQAPRNSTYGRKFYCTRHYAKREKGDPCHK